MSEFNWLKNYLESEIELEKNRISLVTSDNSGNLRMYHYGVLDTLKEILFKIKKIEEKK